MENENIPMIHGKIKLWPKAVLGIILNHLEFQKIHEEPIIRDDLIAGYTCTVHRIGHEPVTKSVIVNNDVGLRLLKYTAGNKDHECLLKLQARELALRDQFSDVIEEIESFIESLKESHET